VLLTFDDSPLRVSLLQAVAIIQHEGLAHQLAPEQLKLMARERMAHVVPSLDKTVINHGLGLLKQYVGSVVALV
jgi:hypothetical protein